MVVKLVISDAHTGLKKAISTVFQGAAWQRCRVHFMRNVLSIVPRTSQDMVAAVIRTIFAQPDDVQALQGDAEQRGWDGEVARHATTAAAITSHLRQVRR